MQLWQRIWWKLFPPVCPPEWLSAFQGHGLEIGGPSQIFTRRGALPLYPRVNRLDNCVFGANVWDQSHPVPGEHFIAEATALDFAANASYDFVVSSHMLEHTANPLKALREWYRVLKPGPLFLAVPHRDRTFDHRRPVTTFTHLLQDYEEDRNEDDLTHLPEILALHDLTRDPQAGTAEQFRERSERNAQYRCLHQHVFDERLIRQALEHAGFRVEDVRCIDPIHIVALAYK